MGGYPAGSEWFAGGVDERAVYNRALAANEINAIYQSPAGKCFP